MFSNVDVKNEKDCICLDVYLFWVQKYRHDDQCNIRVTFERHGVENSCCGRGLSATTGEKADSEAFSPLSKVMMLLIYARNEIKRCQFMERCLIFECAF